MKEDSISNKLQELFDLLKSGALDREEYNLLKKKLIDSSRNHGNDVLDKNSGNNLLDSLLNDTHQETKPENVTTDNEFTAAGDNFKENQNKESKTFSFNNKYFRYILFGIPLILIIILTCIFIKPKSSNWNESSATNIIMAELNKYPNWFLLKFAEKDSEMKHKILLFNDFEYDDKHIKVALTTSTTHNFDSPRYQGELSIFEFEEGANWELTRKFIGFTLATIQPSKDSLKFIMIKKNQYALYHEGTHHSNDDSATTKDLYSLVNGKFTKIFGLYYPWGVKSTYSDIPVWKFIPKDDGYYDIIAEKNKSRSRTNPSPDREYFFDGTHYIER